MEICSRFESTFATGAEYVMTSVFGSVASTFFTFARPAARLPAGPSAYLMIVLKVNGTSSAAGASPTGHWGLGAVWNVQVRPSEDSSHLLAKSGRKSSVFRSIWTSCG